MEKDEGKSLETPRPVSKETETDGELLARLQRGESAAAHEFYDRYAQRLYRFILHTLGGRAPAEAEDLLHETLMALADALPSFRGDCSLLTFACAIAHRKVASFLRANSRRERTAEMFASQSLNNGVEAGREEVRAALAALQPEYREVLVLKYVEELSVTDMTVILGMSEHAVESRLARARRALARELKGEK